MTKKRSILIATSVLLLMILALSITMSRLAYSDYENENFKIAKFSADGKVSSSWYEVKDTTKVKAGKLVPGMVGKWNFTVDAKDSEVGIEYIASFENVQNVPSNMVFYIDNDYDNEYTSLNDVVTALNQNNVITTSDATRTKSHEIMWSWEDNGALSNDETNALQGKKFQADLKVIVRQVDPGTQGGTGVMTRSSSSTVNDEL